MNLAVSPKLTDLEEMFLMNMLVEAAHGTDSITTCSSEHDLVCIGPTPRTNGLTYTDKGNVVVRARAQSDWQHPSHHRTLNKSMGEDAADWRLLHRFRGHLWSGRGFQGSLEVDGLGHPLAISQNPCLERHLL